MTISDFHLECRSEEEALHKRIEELEKERFMLEDYCEKLRYQTTNQDVVIANQQARIDELKKQYDEAFKDSGGLLAKQQLVKMNDAQQARIDELKKAFYRMEASAIGPVNRMRDTDQITVGYKEFSALATLMEASDEDASGYTRMERCFNSRLSKIR